jgi:hypothetical protein
MNHKRKMYRQGDILLREIGGLPPGAKPFQDQEQARILAMGEKTGHMHILTNGTVYAAPGANGQRRIISNSDPSQLIHDEHAAIDIPPGIYELIQQRTYEPGETPQTALAPAQPAAGPAPRPARASPTVLQRLRETWRDVTD